MNSFLSLLEALLVSAVVLVIAGVFCAVVYEEIGRWRRYRRRQKDGGR